MGNYGSGNAQNTALNNQGNLQPEDLPIGEMLDAQIKRLSASLEELQKLKSRLGGAADIRRSEFSRLMGFY